MSARNAISRSILLAIVVVIVIIIAAAGYVALTATTSSVSSSTSTSSATTSPSTTTSTSSTSSSSSTATTSFTNQSTPPLNIQVSQDFGALDPAVGNTYTQVLYEYNVYDNLVTQSPNATVLPHVAKNWTVSPNGTTYIFTLNQGIHFHNGDVLNASDVAFSMERALALGQGFSFIWYGILNSSGIKVLNSTAIEFQTETVFSPFVGTLSLLFIVDQQAVMQHLANTSSSNPMGDWGTAWLNSHDAGSGPYTLANYQPGVSLTLQRFDNYWMGWSNNPRPYNTVTYTLVTSDATVLSLAKSNQLNWVSTYLQYPTYLALQKMGWQFNTYNSSTFYTIKMNTAKAPLNSLDFRKAVSYAFNYTSLQYIFPGSTQLAGPVPQGYLDHNPNVTMYSQNIALAKQLLSESGVNPSNTSLTIVYVAGNIQEQQLAEEFQKDMALIGLQVKIQPQTFLTITQLATNKTTTPDFSIIEFIPFYPDADSLLFSVYDTASHGSWISMEWFSNSTVDNLLSQERATFNQTLRQQIFYQLQQDIVSQAPDLFLAIAPYYVALSPQVGGYTFSLAPSFEYGLYTVYYKG
ncbi:MAG: ABC transporter substrate-binding protein [Nitrososphaerota archaeon]|nr:ABC transporter substrate-binding protein [Nitrososphaerota archaeon]